MREPGAGNHLARLAYLAISLSYRAVQCSANFDDPQGREAGTTVKLLGRRTGDDPERVTRPCGVLFCTFGKVVPKGHFA